MNTPPPADLSPKSQALWIELLQASEFRRDELTALERALRLFDDADKLRADGELKLSLDCSNAALRYWRLLKFVEPSPARRPGRPSGDEWSSKRRSQAQDAVMRQDAPYAD